MAFNNRASRLYVVDEATDGTLDWPSAGSEAIALQEGFEMNPENEVLSSAEIRASIGQTKRILGLERPVMTFSHYLRHSGTEGATPDFHLLWKSIFGSSTTNGTERTLTSSSTVTLLKLAAGGSDFSKGFAFLIKDGTNGYAIRNADSIATNDITINFALDNAPASGVTLGKCINYTPVSTGHPTLSFFIYRANGADIEAMAGGLVTGLEISVEVGQLMNMSFTASGVKYFFNPIEITSTTKHIDIEDDQGNASAVLQEKTYRTPQELAQAAEDAINAVTTETWTVVYNSSGANAGKFTFSATGTVVKLEWNTGTNTATSAAAKFGFSTAADSTGSTSYTSTNAQTLTDALTPALDSSDPVVSKDNEVLVGDRSDYVSMCVQSMTCAINLEQQDVRCISAESGVDSKVVRQRTSSIEFTAVLERYDADKFDRFINNTETKFAFNWGVKAGGNWVAGKCGNIYSPQGSITGFRVGESDGIVTMALTFTPYVDTSGNPEIYANLL